MKQLAIGLVVYVALLAAQTSYRYWPVYTSGVTAPTQCCKAGNGFLFSADKGTISVAIQVRGVLVVYDPALKGWPLPSRFARKVAVFVNGLRAREGNQYRIVNAVIVATGTGDQMQPGFEVMVDYEI